MLLSEPATTLTDYALAAASFGFALSLARSITPRRRVTAWLWIAAFVAAGAAATAGGSFHGLATTLGPGTLRALWNFTVFSMGACGAFIAAGIHAARVSRQDRTIPWLAAGIAVTLAGAGVQRGWLPAPPRLNHNAAYHVIQLIALYCLFRCARTARDR